jgi:hypothetical protein
MPIDVFYPLLQVSGADAAVPYPNCILFMSCMGLLLRGIKKVFGVVIVR